MQERQPSVTQFWLPHRVYTGYLRTTVIPPTLRSAPHFALEGVPSHTPVGVIWDHLPILAAEPEYELDIHYQTPLRFEWHQKGLTPSPTCLPWQGSFRKGCGHSATKRVHDSQKILIGAAASLLCAPAIVRVGSLMPLRGIILPIDRQWFGSVIRMYVFAKMPTITKLQNAGLTAGMDRRRIQQTAA